MHEMSIAQALVEQVRRHTPQGHHATIVRVEVGPLQGIDPAALQMAWEANTCGTELCGAKLEIAALPYKLTCPRCGRVWTAEDPFDPCACGSDALSEGGGDLRLMSMEVEPVEANPSYMEPSMHVRT
jgi:hydrogenase nickel insertion protein HypA